MYKKLEVSSKIVMYHMLLFGRIIFQGYKTYNIKYRYKSFFSKVNLNILPKSYQEVVTSTMSDSNIIHAFMWYTWCVKL